MKRHYFISDDLDDLEAVEAELENEGISTLQIHVLSQDDAATEQRNLHDVASFLKKDVVRSTEVGALLGIIGFVLVITVTHFTGLAETSAGWVPFIFLALVVLGFLTWEGGFRGIQEPNHHFVRFQKALDDGKHILFVDVDKDEQQVAEKVIASHPHLEAAGMEDSGPHWMVVLQQKFLNFFRALP